MTGPHDITRGGVYLGSKVTGARCQILLGACLGRRKLIRQYLKHSGLTEFITVAGLSASSTQQFLPE